MEPGEPLGHEAVGVVEAVGDEVEARRAGRSRRRRVQRRVRTLLVLRQRPVGALRRRSRSSATGSSAGRCPARRRSGSGCPNADVNLLPLPDGVDDDAGVFVGDVLTTGLLRRVPRRRPSRRRRRGPRLRPGRVLHDRGAAGAGRADRLRARPGAVAARARRSRRRDPGAHRRAEPGHGARGGDRRAGRRRRDRRGRASRRVRRRDRHGPARRHRRGARGLLLRDDRAAARRVLVTGAHPPVRGSHAGARVVGRRDGRRSREARSIPRR